MIVTSMQGRALHEGESVSTEKRRRDGAKMSSEIVRKPPVGTQLISRLRICSSIAYEGSARHTTAIPGERSASDKQAAFS